MLWKKHSERLYLSYLLLLLLSCCTHPSIIHPPSHCCVLSMQPLIRPSLPAGCLSCLSPGLLLSPLPRSAATPPLPPQHAPPPSTTRSTRSYTSHNPPPVPPPRALSLALDTHRRQDNFLGLLPWKLSGVQPVMMPHPSPRSRLSLQETLQSSK